MTTLGDSIMNMKSLQSRMQGRLASTRSTGPANTHHSGTFDNLGQRDNNAPDDWHRTLTGRQAPEPVSQKLKMIYGQVISEQLPPEMLDLLSKLDEKSVEN